MNMMDCQHKYQSRYFEWDKTKVPNVTHPNDVPRKAILEKGYVCTNCGAKFLDKEVTAEGQ